MLMEKELLVMEYEDEGVLVFGRIDLSQLKVMTK